MKFLALLTAALLSTATSVVAAPAPVASPNEIDSEALKRSINDAYERAFSAASPANLDKRQLLSSTRNDLQNGRCAEAILIWARGTTETGNVGTVLSGPVFSALDLTSLRNKYIVQGVNDYPADVAGYLAGGSRTGARNMAAQVARAASQCPTSKVILVGYSQGAQVTHLAADLIPSSQYSKVAGILLFGDPNNGDRFPGTLNNNVRTYCDLADPICYGLPYPVGTHLTYYLDAATAAAWVASKV